MALTKVIGEGVGSLGTSSLTHGSDSGDTRFTLNSANQYTMVIKKAGDIAGQIGGGGADVLRFSNAAGATIMEMNAGQITMPLQPAFLAQPASAQNNIAVGTAVAVALGTERYDQNADFASNTFTAPVTGKYMLCANLFLIDIDSAANYYQVSIVTSNRTYYWSYDGASSDEDPNRLQGQVNVVADMDASDTATVVITISSGGSAQTDIATESYFSGALIC